MHLDFCKLALSSLLFFFDYCSITMTLVSCNPLFIYIDEYWDLQSQYWLLVWECSCYPILHFTSLLILSLYLLFLFFSIYSLKTACSSLHHTEEFQECQCAFKLQTVKFPDKFIQLLTVRICFFYHFCSLSVYFFEPSWESTLADVHGVFSNLIL